MASRIRNGRRLPGTQTLHEIHRELDIPLPELMAAHQEGAASFGRVVTERIDMAAA